MIPLFSSEVHLLMIPHDEIVSAAPCNQDLHDMSTSMSHENVQYPSEAHAQIMQKISFRSPTMLLSQGKCVSHV